VGAPAGANSHLQRRVETGVFNIVGAVNQSAVCGAVATVVETKQRQRLSN